ncbi:MAG: DUF3575 domain-containing protein [Rikenellaceae bacterium]
MINTEFKNIIRWSILSIAILSTTTLFGQTKYYTQQEVDAIVKGADTVIYRYHTPPEERVRCALVFENRDVDVDWEVDTLPRRILFALKTNLLYDAVSAINLGVEIPIGSRYSLEAEWIFPWWLSDSRQRCFEMLCGTLEGRYWFGDRSLYEPLTGWMCGLYVGGGYYDLEWDGTGYQGEFMLMGGLSGGYAHRVGRRMRLEYSLGVGVLMTKYRKYEAQECGMGWNLLRTSRGRRNWFGPTQVAISLSYMLHRADKRGGAR